MTINKFQLGDRVTIKENLLYISHLIKPGWQGTVCWMPSANSSVASVGVAFDYLSYGHTCRGTCKDGYGWYISVNDLVLLDDIDRFNDIDLSDVEFTDLLMAGGV